MDGIPKALPALAYAYKVLGKAQGAVAVPAAGEADGIGDELLALVAKARRAGIDPEDALRRRAAAYVERFRAQET
jgi:XTP/dITP diphosphohydrolase